MKIIMAGLRYSLLAQYNHMFLAIGLCKIKAESSFTDWCWNFHNFPLLKSCSLHFAIPKSKLIIFIRCTLETCQPSKRIYTPIGISWWGIWRNVRISTSSCCNTIARSLLGSVTWRQMCLSTTRLYSTRHFLTRMIVLSWRWLQKKTRLLENTRAKWLLIRIL